MKVVFIAKSFKYGSVLLQFNVYVFGETNMQLVKLQSCCRNRIKPNKEFSNFSNCISIPLSELLVICIYDTLTMHRERERKSAYIGTYRCMNFIILLYSIHFTYSYFIELTNIYIYMCQKYMQKKLVLVNV